MGGSWDMRGIGLFDVRGRKIWFTSHELRFPLLLAPTIQAPVLEVLGIAYLGGALFFDAIHAWNGGYNDLQPSIYAGETIASTGFGFRLNLFGAFVLRYDIGWRFREGFAYSDKRFDQFFFGYNF